MKVSALIVISSLHIIKTCVALSVKEQNVTMAPSKTVNFPPMSSEHECSDELTEPKKMISELLVPSSSQNLPAKSTIANYMTSDIIEKVRNDEATIIMDSSLERRNLSSKDSNWDNDDIFVPLFLLSANIVVSGLIIKGILKGTGTELTYEGWSV